MVKVTNLQGMDQVLLVILSCGASDACDIRHDDHKSSSSVPLSLDQMTTNNKISL